MYTALEKEFVNRFGTSPEHIFFCPGRVNLIGEHIDYNGGKVMPCAISKGVWLAISKNKDKRLRFQCLDFPEVAELNLQPSYSKAADKWFNYPLGVINQLLQDDCPVSGIDMLFSANLPVAAGLSSSAAIEVLTAFALNELFQCGISQKDIALLSQKAENEFIGVNSGIMDQFAVAMGKKDKAILLNCDTLEYGYLSFAISGYKLVVINSNKQRVLADSKYNERFAECGAALKVLKQQLDITHLCDITPETLESNLYLLADPVLAKRAMHVVTENGRVKKAKDALQSGNIEMFGQLLYASHQSLKEWYEVSGKELDTIVDFAKTYNSCIGARMTGAGFGGCAIALVKEEMTNDFSIQLEDYYNERIGYRPDAFVTDVGDGVREVER